MYATRRWLSLLLVLAAAAPAGAAAARPGTLDRSFGGDGRIAIRLPGERMRPAALATQPDGKLVVAGWLADSATEYPGMHYGRALVLRVLDDGRLDPSFGTGGVARVRFPLQVAPRGVAVQPDGRILLAGAAIVEPGDVRGAVMRLLPDGSPDASFGSGGLATVRADARGTYVPPVFFLRELAVLPDGRVVAAGETYPADVHNSADLIVARFLPDGTPDPGFAGDGSTNSFSNASAHHPAAIVVRPDDSVVVLGWLDDYFGGSVHFALDVTTGPGPVQHYAVRGTDSITGAAAAAQADGSIVLAADTDRPALTWLRLGRSLEVLERGSARATGGRVAGSKALVFDARGAVITAGLLDPTYPAGPIGVQRHRPNGGYTVDRSFGRSAGVTRLRLGRTIGAIGAALSGDRLVAGAHSETYGPFADQTLLLQRLHAHHDDAGPIVRFRGLPTKRCIAGTRRPLVRIRDMSRVRVTVRIGRRVIERGSDKRFRVAVAAGELRPGVHRFVVTARDAAGHLGGRSATFSVCR